jgi:EAL domain-containing protein (putative c-di-GMP-specific phosphodiesterase class I)/CheY-like chemotaxis protein
MTETMSEAQILIIDDDREFTSLTTSFLDSRNYKVMVANTGTEGLAKVEHNPDLVLLDLTLPDMEGFEICRKIREDRRFRHIPIIILSARDAPLDKIKGLYIGADDYVTKPFDREELIARIGAVLRRCRFTEQAKEDKEQVMGELKNILKEGLITPFFQPIFLFDGFQPLGFEVLSRPPQEGLLNNPEYLFKAALNFGRYFELEMLCWRKCFTQWQKGGGKGKIFLNCSPYLIEHKKFDETVLSWEDFSSEAMVLEITERMAIHDYAMFFEKLRGFKSKGVDIAVDDVGGGYASLDTIAQTLPTYVKIDIALIRDIHTSRLKQSIVESLVSFCKKNDIATIAEGIEQMEELKKLVELKVDCGQGYLLAKPSPEIVTESAVRL